MRRTMTLLGLLATGLLLATASVGAAPPAATPKGPEYVGVNKCRMCHMPLYKAWSATKHANALAALQKVDPKVADTVAAKLKVTLKGTAATTDGCVECHVTGFKAPGGYPQADSLKNVAVANVTCEACHGPGSKHVPAPMAEKKKTISKVVAADACMKCHTPVMSPTFNYDERKGKVHPVPKTG